MPNIAHIALAALERTGRMTALVTQNVDGLHQRADSRHVIDLHGRLDAVICLSCAGRWSRAQLQSNIDEANPDWRSAPFTPAPDGDADIAAADLSRFRPPYCRRCAGLLKPDVVFFGENVPRSRLRQALDALDTADAMLAIGTSLMVYSGFRFARLAAAAGKPLAILNQGRTRADALAGLRLDGDAGQILCQAIPTPATAQRRPPPR